MSLKKFIILIILITLGGCGDNPQPTPTPSNTGSNLAAVGTNTSTVISSTTTTANVSMTITPAGIVNPTTPSIKPTPTRRVYTEPTIPTPAPTNIVSTKLSNTSEFISNVLTLGNGSTITVLTPTTKLGEIVKLPFGYGTNISMRPTSQPPSTSYTDALKTIVDLDIPIAYGGMFYGKNIEITIVYGLVTFGYATDKYKDAKEGLPEECRNWIGMCNYKPQVCKNAKCTYTGEVVTRIIDRPMWIVNYLVDGHLAAPVIGVPPGTTCKPDCQVRTPSLINISHVIDEKTMNVVLSWQH